MSKFWSDQHTITSLFEALFGHVRSIFWQTASGIAYLRGLLSGNSLAICIEIEGALLALSLLVRPMFIAIEASRFLFLFFHLSSLLFLSLLHALSTGWTSCFLLLCFQHNFQVLIYVHLDVLVKILKLLVTGEDWSWASVILSCWLSQVSFEARRSCD